MKTLKFKTNINCSGCIGQVTPHLNRVKEIEKWQVEIANPQKILTIETSTLKPEEIVNIIAQAGFKAESI